MNNKNDIEKKYFEKVVYKFFPEIRNHLYLVNISNHNNNLTIKLNENAFIDGYPDKYKPNSNKVVHFTSLKVLFSILNEKAIRLYNLKSMNDPNEFSYIFENHKLNEKLINNLKSDIYISSFCDSSILLENNDNILNLWRLYGDGGNGVAIEFEIDKDIKHKFNFMLTKLVYTKIKIDEFLRYNNEFELENKVSVDYSNVLEYLACLHKNPYYKIEEEIRLVHFGDSTNPLGLGMRNKYNKLDMSEYYKPDISKSGEIINYYKFPLCKEIQNHPIISISKIQFGFKISDKLFEEYKNFVNSFFKIWKSLKEYPLKNIPKPIIERSPLKDIYR